MKAQPPGSRGTVPSQAAQRPRWRQVELLASTFELCTVSITHLQLPTSTLTAPHPIFTPVFPTL